MNPEDAAALADLLERHFDFVADAIVESRDMAPRVPGDRDTGDVLEDLIGRLRHLAGAR